VRLLFDENLGVLSARWARTAFNVDVADAWRVCLVVVSRRLKCLAFHFEVNLDVTVSGFDAKGER
jgi:hypothetical protein